MNNKKFFFKKHSLKFFLNFLNFTILLSGVLLFLTTEGFLI